jgi:hypothetical protein
MLKLEPGHKMMTLDITSLYTNIPTKEVLNIVESILHNSTHIDIRTQKDVLEMINDMHTSTCTHTHICLFG